MKLPTRNFRLMLARKNDGHIDAVFYDVSPKSDLREWWISRELWGHEWTGRLRRSPDTETPFDDGVKLPRKAAAELGALYDQIRENGFVDFQAA